MAYFERDSDGNVMYSYYNVSGMIMDSCATPNLIDIYINGEEFHEAVKFSFDNIDLHSAKAVEQFDKKYKKTATWIRNKINGIYS